MINNGDIVIAPTFKNEKNEQFLDVIVPVERIPMLIWCLLFLVCLLLCCETDGRPRNRPETEKLGHEQGLLVVPGLGRADRLETVVHNLRILSKHHFMSHEMSWDCIVYIYASRELISFWSRKDDLRIVYDLCHVVEVPNKRVTENLYMVQPALIERTYSKVMILLDDCKIKDPASFNLTSIMEIMRREQLTVASPMIVGANKGGGQKFRNIMQTPALRGFEGFVSNFVEIFVWVMTMPAYTALWELFFPAVNPYAWGYDFWYDGYAAQRVPGHKMGIIATQQVVHVQNAEDPILGRTDNTDVKVKWNAVLAQERHYKLYLGVDLQHYRAHLRISNTSWNGAVQSLIPKK